MLRRKTDHSVIERRRREKINLRLIELQSLVPACLEEAVETLERKKPSGSGKGRGKKTMDEEEIKRERERKLKEEMVLEKLCIISHTVGEWCVRS